MAHGHGGFRPGAGRKPGQKTRAAVERELRTRSYQTKAEAEGMLPLDIMLTTMKELWEQGDKMGAVTVARDAAPYIHQRLQATDMSMHSDNVHRVFSDKPLNNEEWCERYGIEADNDQAANVSPDVDTDDGEAEVA